MTIDDENSIYVGGLPYEATEESLHRAFDLFGSVVAVKIINDREVGGKCYGFVTFTNPRSAINAIADMNGRTIGGRVVRVNEVRTRAGRPMFHRENFRRDARRDIDWDRDRERDRERDYIRDRDRYRDREPGRSRDRDRERERDYDHGYDSDRARDHAIDLNRDLDDRDRVDRDRDLDDRDRERIKDHDRDWERDHDLDWDRNREIKLKDHDGGKDKERQPRNKLSSRLSERRSRELSSNSSDDYHIPPIQVKEQLELSSQRHEELHKEICQIQDTIEEKEQLISDLKEKAQKLEAAVVDAKKVSSQRQLMLTKLHRCFLQAQDHAEKLKSSEQELQSLVERAVAEVDGTDDANTRNGSIYANGQI